MKADDLAGIAARAGDFVLITGCSGGGKSTLLAELARRGFATCEEPGRRIVREELAGDGNALPWVNEARFAERAARMSLDNMARAAERGGITFFDRGLLDAVCAMERMQHRVPEDIAEAFAFARYAPRVFLAPPWPEIFVTDAERKHGLEEARIEYDHLARRLPDLGYAVEFLPKIAVEGRADFVLARSGAEPKGRLV